jgi:hypothetical protein
VRPSLERSSVLNEVPKETSFRACIALANDINLRRDDKLIRVIFSQGLHDSTKSNGEFITTCIEFDMRHVDIFE